MNGKALLFLSKKEAQLNPEVSAADAKRQRFAVGANGWVKIPLDAALCDAVLKRRVAESHAAMSGTPVAKRRHAN